MLDSPRIQEAPYIPPRGTLIVFCSISKNCLLEKMMISFPKYHFYPEVSGQAILHWLFYILHFPLATQMQKELRSFFISGMKTSPFGGLRGLHPRIFFKRNFQTIHSVIDGVNTEYISQSHFVFPKTWCAVKSGSRC